MAKWGEGDPRWIVEERPDATNVNNWHWTEKDATPWSKDKLKSLLSNLVIKDEATSAKCTITDIDKLEGEAVANNRKAKLIFFYEWTIDLNWTGTVGESGEEIKGKVHIPNLSEENDPREVDVEVTVSTSGNEADKLKEFMRKTGAKKIREQMTTYIATLKEEFSQGMILPKKEETTKAAVNKTNVTSRVFTPVQSKETKGLGVKIETTTLKDELNFKCTVNELYNALTIPEMVQAFTRGPIKMDVEKGGKFSFFNGFVCGSFVDIVPNEKLVQKWRLKSWPDEHYSTVTFTFKDKGDSADLIVHQTGVPTSNLEETKQGWHRYYWESIRQTFGFGAPIL
ncbi:activator of 90 kDa heat shock protein ATPase homolog 1-like [Artemia franciscana]